MHGPTPEEAAMLAMSIPLDFARRGRNLAWAALAGAAAFEPLVHHPRRDVIDPLHGARFFYHAHRVAGDALQEHGHFHLFHEKAGGLSHLAALSLDAQGRPLRWFCPNQWVTGERWRPASRWRPVLHGFTVNTRGRLGPVARWLSAMVSLYRHELFELLQERDDIVAQSAPSPAQRASLFANRQVHILCSRPVSLQDKVRSLL
jgi:hypothetical protein